MRVSVVLPVAAAVASLAVGYYEPASPTVRGAAFVATGVFVAAAGAGVPRKSTWAMMSTWRRYK